MKARRAKHGRIVVVGDLNGADDALEELLRGTRLVDRHGHWAGGHAELVQLGDLFNRGGGARTAFARLLALRRQAARAGGRVTVLLGNHEAMVALRHEAYCTVEEYLSFATEEERTRWNLRVRRAMFRILRDHGPRGPVLPLAPRLEAWKIANVPGRLAFRRAVSDKGDIGRAIRKLPVAYRSQRIVFVHAGLLPEWAEHGISGLNRLAAKQWRDVGAFIRKAPPTGLFRSTTGPLWDRSLAYGETGALAKIKRSLLLLDADRMVVGHTQTETVSGGQPGRILLKLGGRLVMADVGLSSGSRSPRAALVIGRGRGHEWTPDGSRRLW